MNMKVINSTWFTQAGQQNTIGIVAGLDTITGEVKTCIGIGNGYNQTIDEEHILKTGAKVSSLDITNFTITSGIIAQKILEQAQDD